MEKTYKILAYCAISILLCVIIAMIVYDYKDNQGPYRITLYIGESQAKTWVVPNYPDTSTMGSGFIIKTEDGQKIVISGNVVIEQIPR